ncbi:MAG: DJ-1/PfpI family protein [Lachnospiraceae bacterium]|nr:DJ-1/PfpI family protein [Lachnospiraceae bacterium]
MKKVCVFLANGLEECEGLITIDILRRAGIEVTTASIHDERMIESSHKIRFEADALAKELSYEGFDMVILPGGLGGTQNLAASPLVAQVVREFVQRPDKQAAAICAAPSVLGELGLLKGRRATCYPGFEAKLLGAEATGEAVTEDGNIITGRGLGAAIPFALHLVSRLEGAEKAEEIRQQIEYPFGI